MTFSVQGSNPLSLPYFVDLIDPNTLRQYIVPEFHQHLWQALAIAYKVYESAIRPTGNNRNNPRYGFAFPINPEVLTYAMELAKDKTVLCVAAASGEDGILCAFAGAKKVYINDLDPTEIKRFKELETTLPQSVVHRLEAIEGDCLTLLEQKPLLNKKIDLILCNNLIHFFKTEEMIRFFDVMKQLLKEDGSLILGVNSVYSQRPCEDIVVANPDATFFRFVQCLVYYESDVPTTAIYNDVTVLPENTIAEMHSSPVRLYTREKGKSWKVDRDAFQRLPANLKPKIKEAIEKQNANLKGAEFGKIQVVTATFRLYSHKTITDLFIEHGFRVQATYNMQPDGHLCRDDNPFGKVRTIVAIATPHFA